MWLVKFPPNTARLHQAIKLTSYVIFTSSPLKANQCTRSIVPQKLTRNQSNSTRGSECIPTESRPNVAIDIICNDIMKRRIFLLQVTFTSMVSHSLSDRISCSIQMKCDLDPFVTNMASCSMNI